MIDPPLPPSDLTKQWWYEAQESEHMDLPCWVTYVATQAAAWGYKQRLIEEDQFLMQIVPPPDETELWCGGKGGWDNYVERWH
jgi:hypothetical protein